MSFDSPPLPHIRNATLNDVPAIAEIYGHAVRFGTASFEIEPPTEVEMAKRMEALLTGGFPYLAAEADGALIGYAYAGPYRPRLAYRWTLEDSIYLAPNAQGLGLGTRLLAELVRRGEAQGYRQMIAVIGDSNNQKPSIALHRKAGFDHIGAFRSVGFKHGRWLNTVLMQRALGDGDKGPASEPIQAP